MTINKKFNINTTFINELINNMNNNLDTDNKIYRDQKLTGFAVKKQKNKISYIAEIKVKGKNYRKVLGNAQIISNSTARNQAKKFLSDMVNGINVIEIEKEDKIKNITLEEAFNDYLSDKKREKNTVKEYKRIMNRYFQNWLNRSLNTITDDMVTTLYKDMSKTPYMANRIFTILSSIYAYAMIKYRVNDKFIITRNPCQSLKIIDKYKEKPRSIYVDPEQIADFWKATEPDMYDTTKMSQTKVLCRLCILTGCREQEICTLKRKDINDKIEIIQISHTKNKRPHIVAYGKYTKSILDELCKGLKDDDYLFPSNTKSGHLEYHSKYIEKLNKKSGVKFSLHDLRRSFTTYGALFLEIESNIVDILTNHKNNNVTYDHYVTVGTSGFQKLRTSFQKIEDFILEKVN